MRITKSTCKPGSAIVEVTSMDHFTTYGTITLISKEGIDVLRAELGIDPLEAQRQVWRAQEICQSNIARREREAFPITQEERERRRAENPEEYARLVNYASTIEIASFAAMRAVEASRGYDANANWLAASTYAAYLRASSARINF
jgi:hypothetical protein